jgi:prepilin-type processing-associated H-X9-DG protein
MIRSAYLTLGAAAFLGATLFANLAHKAEAAGAMAAPEYAVIQWDGDRKTQVIWADGHVEFLSTLLLGLAKPGEDVHERGFIMTQLINKIAKQGYEYAGMASGEEILMKKIR